MRKFVPALCFAVSCAAPSFASACVNLITPGLEGWEEVTFNNLEPNRWSEQNGALTVMSDKSVSILYRKVEIDPSKTPWLSWQWKVDQGPPATDLSKKGGDDRALSVNVGFAYDRSEASFSERMRRMIVESVAGEDAPGRVLDFVWGGNAPVGSVVSDPYTTASGGIITLRTMDEPSSGWIQESIDISKAYISRWKQNPTKIINVGIYGDSDDTKSRIVAGLDKLCFSAE